MNSTENTHNNLDNQEIPKSYSENKRHPHNNPVNPEIPKSCSDNINELTHKIIGCAMQVHRVLGNGFQEVIYQRALAIEMRCANLAFKREKEMDIYYRDHKIGTRRVDFFVEEKVMVELKAVEKIEDVHKAQAINYCEAYNIADGLLINFGGTSLDFRRVYNKKLVKPNQNNFNTKNQ